MRALIVEDETTSQKLMEMMLEPYADVLDSAPDGVVAVEKFAKALENGEAYDLVCMDIMMPHMDGQEALRRIRSIEKENGRNGANEAKVIMTTALDDPKNVVDAYYGGGATAYLPKPIDHELFLHILRKLELID